VRADGADVVEAGHVGPVLREDVAAVGIALDLPRDRAEAGALEAELQAADAAEEGADPHGEPSSARTTL
jgi:hypothetical protein